MCRRGRHLVSWKTNGRNLIKCFFLLSASAWLPKLNFFPLQCFLRSKKDIVLPLPLLALLPLLPLLSLLPFLPLLPLLIILAAVDLTKIGIPESIASSEMASLYRIIFIIALVGWTTVARLVRAATLSVRTREFVRAAEAMGAGSTTIMLRHILPNVISPIVVATTLSIGSVILLESVLSFLGLGIQPPIPSWGNMLTNAQELATRAPALAVWPGAIIFVTVLAFNFLGDGLQDALDPRAMRR